MGLSVGSLYAELDIDDGPLRRGLSGMKGSITSKLGPILATAAVAGGIAIAAGLYKGVMAASDLNESLSKAKTVFGQYFSEVDKFASGAAESVGMTRQAALESAGTFGNLFTALKIGKGPAADMSTSLLQLAGDLASFNNVDPSEAFEAIRAGLVGETEPMRRFGVNMNDATLKAQALKMGISDGTNVLTPAAKAQAAYALIMAQTNTAQGDFARTSGGLANQMRILKAEVGNTAASLGQVFLPAAIAAVKGLRGLGKEVAPALGAVKGWITKNGPGMTAAISKSFSDMGKDVAPGFASIGKLLSQLWEIIGPPLSKVAAYIGDALVQVDKYLRPLRVEFLATMAKVIASVVKVAQMIKTHWAGIATVVVPIFNIIKTVISTVFKVIVDIIRISMALVRGDWKGAWDGVKRIVSTVAHAVVTVVQNLGRLAVALLRAAWNLLKAATSAAWDAIRNAVKSKVSNLLTFLSGLPGKIIRAIGGLGRTLYDAGSSLIHGLINGIGDALSALWEKISSVASTIKDKFTSILHIGSPSKVFRGYGINIMQGLALGVGDGQRLVDSALAGMTSGITVNAAPRISLVAPAGAGAGSSAGMGGTHVVVNVNLRGGVIGNAREVGYYVADGVVEKMNDDARRRTRTRAIR